MHRVVFDRYIDGACDPRPGAIGPDHDCCVGERLVVVRGDHDDTDHSAVLIATEVLDVHAERDLGAGVDRRVDQDRIQRRCGERAYNASTPYW